MNHERVSLDWVDFIQLTMLVRYFLCRRSFVMIVDILKRITFFFMIIVVGTGEFIMGIPHWNADSRDKLNLVLTMMSIGFFVIVGNILVYIVS